jgi:hypothetical protein
MILFEIRLSSQILICHKRIHKKKSLLPFQNSSPIILQNIFKYLNLEDFSTIQIAYQKSKSSILQKQFLKISKTFFKKTLDHKMIFEFSINSENLSPTKETKIFNSFLKPKPIQFSNFINHVMIYHEFRFISYIDESFSIEQKIKNTKIYKPMTNIQNLPVPLNKLDELSNNSHFSDCLRLFSKFFLNLAFERDHQLYTLFKNRQISTLDYSIAIDSDNTTYFVSLDKTYVVRFTGPIFFFYHIPSGKGYSYSWLSWYLYTNPKEIFSYATVTQIGEFLPSCHHPKVKQINFEKKIKNCVVSKEDEISIRFQLLYRDSKSLLGYSWRYADHLWMDLYL